MNFQEESNNQLNEKRREFSIQIRKEKKEQLFQKQRIKWESQSDFIIDMDNINIFQNQEIVNNVLEQQIQQMLLNNRNRIFNESELAELISFIEQKEDILKLHLGVLGIRKILSVNQPPVNLIIEKNLVKPLVEFMKEEKYPRLQVEAAWALTNVASGTQEQTKKIIEEGAMELFVESILSPNLDLVEQCIWAIGNISADSTYQRDLLNEKGAIENLIQVYGIIKNHNERYPNFIWALSNLVRGLPEPDVNKVVQTLSIFVEALSTSNIMDVVHDSSWAICNIIITINNNENFISSQVLKLGTYIIHHPAFQRILQILSNNTLINLQVPLIKLLGNLAYMDNHNSDLMLDFNILDIINLIYQHQSIQIIREITWSLSNIASSSQYAAKKIISNKETIKYLLHLTNSTVLMIQREVFWVFSGLIKNSNHEDLQTLINDNVFQLLILQLNLENKDQETMSQIAKSIKSSLKKALTNKDLFLTIKHQFEKQGALNRLESMQLHQDPFIQSQIQKILSLLNQEYQSSNNNHIKIEEEKY